MFLKMSIMDTNVFSLFLLVLVVKESRSETCANSVESFCQLIAKCSETSILTCPCLDTMDCEKLKWIDKEGQDIKRMGPGSNPKMYTELNGRELVLFIQSMSKSKTGIYKCVADIDGGVLDVITRSVMAYDPLIFLNWNKTQNITMGRDSHIDCHVRSDTPPRFQWYKGEDELIELTDGDKYEIDSTGLKVKNVTNEDSGIYKCTATEERIGEPFDNVISVEVFRVPTIKFLDAIPDATVILGDELTIECEADGYPLPSYSWKKISEPQQTANNTNETWVQDLNKIMFEIVTDNDRGTYECIARNYAGEEKRTITIEVLSPPTITHFVNMTVPEGIETKLTCKASGRPRPKIVMTFESEKSNADLSLPYNVNDTSETDTEINIIFSEVNRNYEGYFYCNATNNVSDAIEAVYFKVWYKPYFETYFETVWAWKDQTVNLSCENDAYPEALIKWSYHGSNETTSADHIEVSKFLLEDINAKSNNNIFPINFTRSSYYGTYMCTAFNSYGEANKTFYVREGFAPSQIEDVTVSNTTASSATFIIEIPPYKGPNITAIRAEYDEADNYNITHIHRNRTWPIYRPIRLDGLKHSTTYLIKFTAQNDVGLSPFSEMIEFETPEESIPEPLEMEHDYIEMPSNSEPVLNVKIPYDNGQPIDYYVIKYCPEVQEEERPCIEQQIPVTSAVTLNHLDLNTTYLVEVTVHNALGNSAPTSFFLRMPETLRNEQSLLSAGATIAISVVVVVLCIILIDALLYFTRKQGMIASCCHKKNKKRKEDTLHSRDKKGLLKDNGESGPDDAVKRADNGHKEFEYNKTTGVITGKHSAV